MPSSAYEAHTSNTRGELGATHDQVGQFLRSLSTLAYAVYPPEKAALYSSSDADRPIFIDVSDVPNSVREHMDVWPNLGFTAVYALEFFAEMTDKENLPSRGSLAFCKQMRQHYLTLLYEAEVGSEQDRPIFSRTLDVFVFDQGVPVAETRESRLPEQEPLEYRLMGEDFRQDAEVPPGLYTVGRHEANEVIWMVSSLAARLGPRPSLSDAIIDR